MFGKWTLKHISSKLNKPLSTHQDRYIHMWRFCICIWLTLSGIYTCTFIVCRVENFTWLPFRFVLCFCKEGTCLTCNKLIPVQAWWETVFVQAEPSLQSRLSLNDFLLHGKTQPGEITYKKGRERKTNRKKTKKQCREKEWGVSSGACQVY